MVTAQEIEEGCKILSVNWRKDVEPEFKQLLFNEFSLKHKWPKGLFKSACIKIIEVEEFFPQVQKIMMWGGKLKRQHDLQQPLQNKATEETYYLTNLPKLIGGSEDLRGEDMDEVTREGTKKVHPKIKSFFQELEAFKAKRRRAELGKRDRSADPEMIALKELQERMEQGVASQGSQKAQEPPSLSY